MRPWKLTSPRLMLLTSLAALCAGCSGGQDTQRAPQPRPTPAPPASAMRPTDAELSCRGCNLVFVSFDALQAAHVSSLGYERHVTPTLDALAARGVSFQNCYSAASWTVPASMTWFTGVYPTEHRMTNKFAVYRPPLSKLANLQELSPNLRTLAEVLRDNGYVTAGFTGNAGVSGGFGYEQGFDVYVHDQGRFDGFDKSVPRALHWLRENKDQPFFLFLHGYDVHGQAAPGGGFDYRFVDADYDRRYSGSPAEQELLREEGLDRGRLNLREQDVRFWRAIYDEKIQRADARFAEFLKEFEQLGLLDNTLFVVTSDHGTEMLEHQRLDHGFTLYNELLHVPLIVCPPKLSRGCTVPHRVGSIDLMPTILDLLGIELSQPLREQLRGESLLPAMRGDDVARNVFSETDYREFTFKRSIITPQGWKLIYTLESRTRELFDLTSDPGETRNLADQQPQRADELQDLLFDHYDSLGHNLTHRQWKPGMNPVYDFATPPREKE